MATSTQQLNYRTAQGYYSRIVGEAADTIYVDFTKARPIRPETTFYMAVTYGIEPVTGASIAAQFAIKPDFDKATAGDWHNFEDSPFTDVAFGRQDSAVAAIRFTATTAGMTIHIWSATEIEVS